MSVALPTSRAHEVEADRLGLRLCARSCHKPSLAAEAHATLAAIERQHGRDAGRAAGGLFATHPATEERLASLQQMAPPPCSADRAPFGAPSQLYGQQAGGVHQAPPRAPLWAALQAAPSARAAGCGICVCFNMQVPQATQLYESCGCSAKSAILLRTLEKGARKAGLGQ